MEDRDLMENELLVIKGVCDLYLHGTIESTTAEVHEAFKCDNGWYNTENAEQEKINQTKQKFMANN